MESVGRWETPRAMLRYAPDQPAALAFLRRPVHFIRSRMGRLTIGGRSASPGPMIRDWPPTPLPQMRSRQVTSRRAGRSLRLLAGTLLLTPATVPAQSEYANTDIGRPIRVEDAYAVDRHALDLRLAPLRVERGRGVSSLSVTPAVAYGLVPRTQVTLGIPVFFRGDGAGTRRGGIAGVDVSALYNFNAETRSLPAFGLRSGVLMPLGEYGPERTYPSLAALATRTMRSTRVHANAQYTFGSRDDNAATERGSNSAGVPLTRWVAGVSADRVFAYRSLLATAEALVSEPLARDGADIEWTATAGVRYQLTPVVVLDGGFGRRMTGASQAWFVTVGVSRRHAVRYLFPGQGAWGR